MTTHEEVQLFAALRGPIIYPDDGGNELMDKTATEDLHAITPAVEEIIRNAEARGRFAQLLEIAEGILRSEMA